LRWSIKQFRVREADEVGCGGRSDLVRLHWRHEPDGGSGETGSGGVAG
jgi:hypothetical protein